MTCAHLLSILYEPRDSVRFLLDTDGLSLPLNDDRFIKLTLCFNSFTTPLTLSGDRDYKRI